MNIYGGRGLYTDGLCEFIQNGGFKGSGYVIGGSAIYITRCTKASRLTHTQAPHAGSAAV